MMKTLCMITWIITALVSINVLTAYYDFDAIGMLMSMIPGAAVAMIWIIGLSGIISMVMLVKTVFMCCPGCGTCPCSCHPNMHNMNNMNKL